jgi:hypothetical protein
MTFRILSAAALAAAVVLPVAAASPAEAQHRRPHYGTVRPVPEIDATAGLAALAAVFAALAFAWERRRQRG